MNHLASKAGSVFPMKRPYRSTLSRSGIFETATLARMWTRNKIQIQIDRILCSSRVGRTKTESTIFETYRLLHPKALCCGFETTKYSGKVRKGEREGILKCLGEEKFPGLFQGPLPSISKHCFPVHIERCSIGANRRSGSFSR